jgi:hypothetical protein
MAKATMKIAPPAHVPLSPDDMPFFESVIVEFAKSELTDHQIELVALVSQNDGGFGTRATRLAAGSCQKTACAGAYKFDYRSASITVLTREGQGRRGKHGGETTKDG